MSYKGRYIAKNPKKYKGDPQKITYRSLWERKFMMYCDTNESVIEWSSEEIIIPYLSPWDGRIHRYFPDFYIKTNQHNGSMKSRHGASMRPSGSMRQSGATITIWNLRF